MGISLYANSKYVSQEFDMSYGGFFTLRSQIANAFDKEFGEHYSQLLKASCSLSGGTEAFNKKMNQILADKRFDGKDDILDFFFASDCGALFHIKLAKSYITLLKMLIFGRAFNTETLVTELKKTGII